MIMRCKITKKCMFLVKCFLIPLKPLKNLLSSMKLSRVGRKSETDKFFLGLISDLPSSVWSASGFFMMLIHSHA